MITAKTLFEVYSLAKRFSDFGEFEQHLKVEFTGKLSTVVIDCELILVRCFPDKKELKECEHYFPSYSDSGGIHYQPCEFCGLVKLNNH